MTKKFLIYIMMGVLMVLCFYNLLSALDPNPSTDPGEPGSGSQTLYDRIDIKCGDPLRPWREKTECIYPGEQLCTPQYCN